MIAFFQKPVREITLADVQELVAEHYPEGYELEFKRTIPDKHGRSSPWMSGKGEVGDYARDEILSEVIAFANARGGSVLVGIDETDEKPPRASSFDPIPRIGDLARRFEDQARACIDPPLPRLEIHPIVFEGDSGVLILNCGASRSAPHRLTTTRDAYVRRGTSTVRMTMREIQDMSLNAARGLEGIANVFGRRRSAFLNWNISEAAGLRITGVPLESMPDPGRLFGRQEFGPVVRNFNAQFETRARRLELPFSATDDRPIVRGLRHSHHSDREDLVIEQHQDGVMDFWLANKQKIGDREPSLVLFHTWVLAGAATVLTLVDRFRRAAGAPNAEFAIEVEFKKFGPVSNTRFLYQGPFADYGQDSYLVGTPAPLLPRLPVGGKEDFDQVIGGLDTDIYDALGVRKAPRSVQVQW